MTHTSSPLRFMQSSQVAQCLQKVILQPRRHLPLHIERDQENMPWQNRTIPNIMRYAKNIQ